MKRSIVIGIATGLVLVFSLAASVGAEETLFFPGSYYLISIGAATSDVDSLVQTGQQQGFTVVTLSDAGLSSYRGTQSTEEPESDLITVKSLLYADGARFLLRVQGERFDYEVRPGDKGYDLVLIPHEDMTASSLVSDVLTALQQLGIVGDEVDMEYKTFVLNPEKSEAPPEGVAIDSNLYNLMIAPDWLAAATKLNLDRTGLRVSVIAEKVPGGAIPEQFAPYVVSQTDTLAKLLLPIEDLVKLASDSGIGYVRPPYQPHPAVP
ncbi:hypothetical protein J7J63_02360 [Candidatus Bipolaricaulota bacterium]|nr:hypothetical protein [Candidatus Bipolaricaulota bacterium]